MSKEFPFLQSFDPIRKLQYINSDPSVMHCHHYSAIFTRLAIDFESHGGTKNMAEAMEEAVYLALRKVFIGEEIKAVHERIRMVEEYFRLTGLGEIKLHADSATGGTATLSRSHIDEGWVKKYGNSKVPVNHVARGFLAGAFEVIHGKPLRSYDVEESASMAMGKAKGDFVIKERGQAWR